MMSAPLVQTQIQARANGELPRVMPVTARIEIDVAVELRGGAAQIWRSTIFSLRSAMASEGLSPFGQALAQFMIVWQR
jgi:hypothetical protein